MKTRRARVKDCVFVIARLYKEPMDDGYTYGLIDSSEGFRVYVKGKIDKRLTFGGEPFEALDMNEAHAYMSGENGEHLGEFRPVQVPLQDGIKMFGRHAFAPLPVFRIRPYQRGRPD